MSVNYPTTATKTYECDSFTHWSFGKYLVTSYPRSLRLYIVLAEKTHKRVVGYKLEAAARAAIAKARESVN